MKSHAKKPDPAVCRSKIQYPTYASAWHSLSKMVKKPRKSCKNGKMNSYRCPICKSIHIGHLREKGDWD